MKLLTLLLMAATAQAQSKLSFTPATQTVRPGQQVTISLSYSGTTDSAVRFYLPTSAGVVPVLTAGSALTQASGKTLSQAVQADRVGVVISGMNQLLLPQGELVKVLYTVPAGTSAGIYTVTASPMDAVKPNGQTDASFIGVASFELVVSAAPTPTPVPPPPPAPTCNWLRRLLGLCK